MPPPQTPGEFDTDAENLAAFQSAFGMEAPCWARRVARRVLLVGLSTVQASLTSARACLHTRVHILQLEVYVCILSPKYY
jgi:hypothetical protein